MSHHISNHRMFDFAEFYCSVALHSPPVVRAAEVGVADGDSLLFLATCLKQQGRDFKITAIDNMAYGGMEQCIQLVGNIYRAGHGDTIEIVPASSLDAACRFPDNLFDFVFIDSSHTYEQTKAEIRLWWRKVKDGGILAGHDYNDGDGKDVKRAVDEVIPRFCARPPLPDGQTFEPQPVLTTHPIGSGSGVWSVTKQFWIPDL